MAALCVNSFWRRALKTLSAQNLPAATMFDGRFSRRLLVSTQPNETFATMLPRERFGQEHFPYSHFP